MAQPKPELSSDPQVIVFNLKRRFSGVSATVNALVPLQSQRWRLGYCGTPLPHGLPGMGLREALRVSRRPAEGEAVRLWHVRRDPEMLAGLIARDLLRLPIRLVFTSAARHPHGPFPRWLISRMDAVIATGEQAAACLPRTRAVLPHGIDIDRFSPPDDRANAWAQTGLGGRLGVGLFGRIRPDKGTDVFVRAMLEVLPRHPDVTAVIGGLAVGKHRTFEARLRAAVEASGLSGRLHFLGEVPAADMPRWYRCCQIVVACPRDEPFGLTPFEAGACGAALICSRTGAFEDLVRPGIEGALVPPGDASALAQVLCDFLNKPISSLQAMGLRARERVHTHFDLVREADGIDHVYRDLFEEARR